MDTLDEIVPYQQAATFRREWCNRGANVTWQPMPTAEHVKGIVDGAPEAFAFLSARFAGLPVPSTCLLP